MCDVEIRIRNSAKNYIFRNRNIAIFSYILPFICNSQFDNYRSITITTHQYHHHNRQFVTNTMKFTAIIFPLELKIIKDHRYQHHK